MSIIIHHRFGERLNSTECYENINTVIIGTFNPGLPIIKNLNETERLQFNELSNSKKFKKFNQILNFYDRPQNRFWKIMDYFNDSNYYEENGIDSININGLKYYDQMGERQLVFERQQDFCKEFGVLITDIVVSITPLSFCNIYDNFPDTTIERSRPVWNTQEIINIVKRHNPKNVLINFSSNSKATPNICAQVSEISKRFPKQTVTSVKSTSGAAGNTYQDLINEWGKYIRKGKK